MNRLIGLEVDRHHKNGSCFRFPQKGLVPTPFNVEVFELCKSMGSVMNDQYAPMSSFNVAVGMCWIPESMPSSNFKVLAHRVMFLLVQVRFNQRMDLVVSCPVPVQGVLAEGRDVGDVQPHVFLGESGPLGWCAVQRWIVVWTLRRRQWRSGCPRLEQFAQLFVASGRAEPWVWLHHPLSTSGLCTPLWRSSVRFRVWGLDGKCMPWGCTWRWLWRSRLRTSGLCTVGVD